MVFKILALAALAAVVWWMTRPRRIADDDTAMVQCEKCGVYHAAGEPCGCKK